MYPIRSKIMKNTFFLGEQLPSAAELMDTDPGVSALRVQLNFAKQDRDAFYKKRHSCVTTAQLLVHSRGSCRDARDRTPVAEDIRQEYYRKNGLVKEIEKRLAEAEKRVWDRISKAIPYKAYIIKPIVDRGANTIVYQLTKGGVNIGEPHQQLDEAKAVVDNEIAAEQSKQVQQWTEERGAAEGVLPAQQKTMVPPPEGTVTVITDTPPSNTTKYLLIGGAALAALMLMK